MGRPLRTTPAGFVYHVLNRANARQTIFQKDGDYEAFLRVLILAVEREPIRLLSFCVLPNHWHLLVWPKTDDAVSRFVGWLTLTHTQRWHAHYHTTGSGHLYQGRFRSFPVQDDDHFLTVARYVERNPLRAGLVARAQQWRWGSLWVRDHPTPATEKLLSAWPLERLAGWVKWVNAAQTAGEEEALRRCLQRGQPFGSESWIEQTVARLGLESAMRPRGRPRKPRATDS
jgi:putative transposase